jgi:hypothetical protein
MKGKGKKHKDQSSINQLINDKIKINTFNNDKKTLTCVNI